MFAVFEEDTHGNLPCALADGIFTESAVAMTTKLRVDEDEDEKILYRQLASILQPIELQIFLTDIICSKMKMPSISSSRMS